MPKGEAARAAAILTPGAADGSTLAVRRGSATHRNGTLSAGASESDGNGTAGSTGGASSSSQLHRVAEKSHPLLRTPSPDPSALADGVFPSSSYSGGEPSIRRRAISGGLNNKMSAKSRGKQREAQEAEDDDGYASDSKDKSSSSRKGGTSAAASINNMMNDLDAYAKKTQDRLEAWFGLTETKPLSKTTPTARPKNTLQARHSSSTLRASDIASSSTSAAVNQEDENDSSTLVYIHHVSPDETLAGISLYYGIEPSVLRRVNKLWAGDKPQMRGQLYVPVDVCSKKPGGSRVGGAGEGEDASTLLQTDAGGARKSSVNGVAYGFWNEERGLIRRVADEEEEASAGTPLQESHLRQHDRASAAALAAAANSEAASTSSASNATSQQLFPTGTSSTPASGYSASHSRAGSSATGGSSAGWFGTRGTQRVPKEELKFFSSSSNASSKGSRTGNGAVAGQSAYGKSGLEDLLQISQERSAIAAGKAKEDDKQHVSLNLGGAPSVEESVDDGLNSDAGTSYSDRIGGGSDDHWRPNKWTLGQRKKSMPVLARTNSDYSAESSRRNADHVASVTGLRPLQLVQSKLATSGMEASSPAGGSERSYSGWNDIPPPGANVAHAYKPKRAAGGSGSSKAHHRLLNDLAAGLPANSGPASGWQRPIGASLPPPPVGAAKVAAIPDPHASASAGFGKLFNDAIRGRISVEGAFEAVLDQVTGKAPPPPSSANARDRRRVNASMPAQVNSLRAEYTDDAGTGHGSSGRVSAEEARASLSLRGGRESDYGDLAKKQVNGVPLNQVSGSLRAAAGSAAMGRVRSRTALKDVEWYKD